MKETDNKRFTPRSPSPNECAVQQRFADQKDFRVTRARPGHVCAIAAVLALGGCGERVPAINVFGAYFPSWMLCILIGIMLTVVARQVFIAVGLDSRIGPRGVIYPALALLIMFAIWIAFFRI
jgi:hypothetical protein